MIKESSSSLVTDLDRRTFLRGTGVGLAALATSGVLAGCSGGADDPNAPKGIENVEQIQLGEEISGVSYPDGYVGPRARNVQKFGDPAKTFKIVVAQNAQTVGDWNNNKFTKWMEERTGVKVEFQAILTTAPDGNTDLTKLNAMLASGELPDAFLGIPMTLDQVSAYGQQGTFVALDDYLETYAPEYRKMNEDYPDFRPLVSATDGKIYQMTGLNDCYHCRISPGRAFINSKYLEAIGMEMPTTTEEFRAVLKALKDNDPSPDKNMIPLAAAISNGNLIDRYIMNAFLYNPGFDGKWLALNGGKVEFVAGKPEWREGLKFLRVLFDDGTLPRESFTMTDEAFRRAGNQGRIGVARGYYWGSFMDMTFDADAAWRDYVSLPPLKGPAGVQYAGWDHYLVRAPHGLVITEKCDDPATLVRWADAQMELQAVMGGYGGVEGENWEWPPADGKGINDKSALFKLIEFPAPEGTGWDQYSVMYRSSDFRLGQYIDPANPDFERDLYQASVVYEPFAQPKDQQVPPLLFDEATTAQKTDTETSLVSFVKQSMAQFSTGEKDINDDDAWNDYVSQLDAMGLPAYLEIVQSAYDNRPK